MPTGATKISELGLLTKDGSEYLPAIQDDGSGGWINGRMSIGDLGANLGNSDLQLTGNRLLDFDSNTMGWLNIKEFIAEATTLPSLGNSSFEFKAFGNTAADYNFIVGNQTQDHTIWYGDGYLKHNGMIEASNIGIGTTANASRGLYIVQSGSDIGIYSQTSSGDAGYFLSYIGRGLTVSGGAYGGVFTSYGNAIDASGDVYGVVGQSPNVGAYFYPTAVGGIGLKAIQNTGAFAIETTGHVKMLSLPTSSAGLASGEIWNDSGNLKIV